MTSIRKKDFMKLNGRGLMIPEGRYHQAYISTNWKQYANSYPAR
jgi:hypothetical protein